jgi:hypothetical protein
MALLVAARLHEGFEDSSQPKRKHHPNGCVHRAEQPTSEHTRRVVKAMTTAQPRATARTAHHLIHTPRTSPSEYRRQITDGLSHGCGGTPAQSGS